MGIQLIWENKDHVGMVMSFQLFSGLEKGKFLAEPGDCKSSFFRQPGKLELDVSS